MVEEATADYCEAVPNDQSSVENHTDDHAASLDDTLESDRPSTVDLDAIESDLASVETALARLEAGTYWTDEVTGEPIPDQVLAHDPLVRRLPR